MEDYSYKNALYFLHGQCTGRGSRAGDVEKKEEICRRMPEFRSFEKVLSQGFVLERMFSITMTNLIDHMPCNAIFYADKLQTLSENNSIVLYLLGEALFLNANYKKIYFLFDKHSLLFKNDNYLVLAAKGLIRIKEFKLC